MAQVGKNIVPAYKVEATFNTAPGASGGTQIRLTPSQGGKYARSLIESQEVRSDMLTTMARLGQHAADLSYGGEFSLGSQNDWLEALMRSTWVAATAITADGGATYTNFQADTTSTFTMTGSGSWITAGVRAGDVIRITNYSTAANNNINLRVSSVTATVITVYGTPLTTGATDAACTVTILKKLKNGATATRRSFYVQEYDTDNDLAIVYGGCRVSSGKISFGPESMANIEFGLVGASATELATGSSPYFTTPTLTTSLPLVVADATIRLAGADILTLSALDLMIDLQARRMPVIGSLVTPDVFDGQMKVNGSFSGLRADLSMLSKIRNETELELHVLLVEPESEPKDCISIFVPRIKVHELTAPRGSDGGLIETLGFTVGKKEGVTGYDESMLTICSSV